LIVERALDDSNAGVNADKIVPLQCFSFRERPQKTEATPARHCRVGAEGASSR
jgi:hypothetical protein